VAAWTERRLRLRRRRRRNAHLLYSATITTTNSSTAHSEPASTATSRRAGTVYWMQLISSVLRASAPICAYSARHSSTHHRLFQVSFFFGGITLQHGARSYSISAADAGTQQQTRRPPLLLSIDGTDGRKDARPLHGHVDEFTPFAVRKTYNSALPQTPVKLYTLNLFSAGTMNYIYFTETVF